MIGAAGTALMRRMASPFLIALALSVAELQALSLLYDYQTGLRPACSETFGTTACGIVGRAVPRSLGVVAAFVLFGVARPQALGRLLAEPPSILKGLALNFAGFSLLSLPALLLPGERLEAHFSSLVFVWLAGALLAAAGALAMVARTSAWRRLLVENGLVLGLLALLGAATPELARMIQPFWQIEAVTDVTFRAVTWLLESLGYAVTADPATRSIGAQEFVVQVSAACSGVEGFALITLFLGIYMALFRREIAFPAAFLLFPIGIALSWTFNVLRISLLLVIGIEGAPELAVGGFHSRAGWLAFTILAFALIFVSRQMPAFRRTDGTPARELPPLFRDPAAAALLPFAIFMISAHVAGAVSETPGVLYPWRVLAMAAALALFWPVWRTLPWRFDPMPVGLGLAIGALWVATAPAAEGTPPHGVLSGGVLVVWIVARIVGTGLLVPVIEEAFFRGYLLDRLAPSKQGWQAVAAVLVSAALFAVLHDRWVAAFLSGVVFGRLVLRSGRVTDAVVAHATANMAIAGWAVASGDWSVI